MAIYCIFKETIYLAAYISRMFIKPSQILRKIAVSIIGKITGSSQKNNVQLMSIMASPLSWILEQPVQLAVMNAVLILVRMMEFVDNFVCECAAGVTSKNYTVDINECNSNPCVNNASCIDSINNYNI